MAAAQIGTESTRRKREALQKEEEQMTQYTREDQHQGWEYKIVRATTNPFRNPETLQTLIEEEALAGWEMVEKFDDNRVRFKRATQHLCTCGTIATSGRLDTNANGGKGIQRLGR